MSRGQKADLTKLSAKALEGVHRGTEVAIRLCLEDLEKIMRKMQEIREEEGRRRGRQDRKGVKATKGLVSRIQMERFKQMSGEADEQG